MSVEALTVWLGFVEGVGLILSPCILPILPLILSASLTGSRRRPYGIICGFVLLFSLFTLFSRALVQYAEINPVYVRMVSYALLMLLGLIMLSGTLTEKFLQLTARLMRVGSGWSAVSPDKEGFWSGFLFGGLTAIIWTPCAGPILAAVIVQTALQQANWSSILTMVAFALGAGVPMLLIALFGRALIQRMSFLTAHAARLRQCLGAIIVVAVFSMIYSDYHASLPPELPAVAKDTLPVSAASHLRNGLSSPYPAPEMEGIDVWLNSPPLQVSNLHGKVVLIDFWTYSCINCLRTLPYLKNWYQKYHDRGLVIIGVHTPEFEFEKDPLNVARAVHDHGIFYPVALDSHYATWTRFNNRYWPAHYLIDRNGRVVYQFFGEGEYDVTENNIRYLLGLKGKGAERATRLTERYNPAETPETYFGYARAVSYAGVMSVVPDKEASYSVPKDLPPNGWALKGRWKILGDRMIAVSKEASFVLHFNARRVFFVMGSSDHLPVPVTFVFQGKKTDREVMSHQLYDVLALKQATDGVLELTAGRPGLELYTATFGE